MLPEKNVHPTNMNQHWQSYLSYSRNRWLIFLFHHLALLIPLTFVIKGSQRAWMKKPVGWKGFWHEWHLGKGHVGSTSALEEWCPLCHQKWRVTVSKGQRNGAACGITCLQRGMLLWNPWNTCGRTGEEDEDVQVGVLQGLNLQQKGRGALLRDSTWGYD